MDWGATTRKLSERRNGFQPVHRLSSKVQLTFRVRPVSRYPLSGTLAMIEPSASSVSVGGDTYSKIHRARQVVIDDNLIATDGSCKFSVLLPILNFVM